MTTVYVLNDKTLKTNIKAVARRESMVNYLIFIIIALNTFDNIGIFTKKSNK